MKKSRYAIKQTKIERHIFISLFKDSLAKDRVSLQVFEKLRKKNHMAKKKANNLILNEHQNAKV